MKEDAVDGGVEKASQCVEQAHVGDKAQFGSRLRFEEARGSV